MLFRIAQYGFHGLHGQHALPPVGRESNREVEYAPVFERMVNLSVKAMLLMKFHVFKE